MSTNVLTTKKGIRNKTSESGVYMNSLLSRKIQIPFNKIGKNIKELLENIIKQQIEGKCTVEGYIKTNSTKILTYSSGVLFENKVEFDIVFECSICCPVEGMLMNCIVKNKTQAGIRAVIDEDKSPVVVYVSRDHHYNNKYFGTVTENDQITVRVIGQRYELNDEQVSIIGEIVEPKEDKIKKNTTMKRKPKLIIKENV
jgi:DNA-directed RNA polymerase subunit E'/Rpb7